MTPFTQMTLALLQELMMTLRANDAGGYKAWLALGIEQLGKVLAGEVESEWMVPLVGGRGEGQADGLAAGGEPLPLVRLKIEKYRKFTHRWEQRTLKTINSSKLS